MKYCTKCLYPETKPDLWFDPLTGECSACLAFDERKNVDWKKQAEKFCSIMNAQTYHWPTYDCIVPVSGGKDSHFQILRVLELGYKPLAVTATTDDLSVIGRRNLNNISKLGVDHIEVSVNSLIRRKINKYTLKEIGDISWAEHVTIFTIPIREAMLRNIPFVIWGENPQNEYGGPNEQQKDSTLSRKWLQEFGGLNGLRVSDLIDRDTFYKRDLFQYTYPSNEELSNRPSPIIEVKGLFLGHYFPWDGYENAVLAQNHGFEWYPGPVEGCGVEYENLDNHQTGIHDYFKWLKYGFGRATDIACNHIRRGRMSRQEGKEHILQFDGWFPRTYLGKPLEDILGRIDVTTDEFIQICDKFTNQTIFNPRSKLSPRPRMKHSILEA